MSQAVAAHPSAAAAPEGELSFSPEPAPVPVPVVTAPPRALSIDLLRGLDVWLMLFVNEMAHVTGTPAFLLHVGADVDGMTITDVVFPAFLFIVGLAIPFAVAARARRGASPLDIWRHVAVRALGLVIMGVFIVNRREGAPDSLIPETIWSTLMFLALIVVWTAPPASPVARRRHRLLRWLGIAVLVGLALVFRHKKGSGLIQLEPSWWGILGIIGWAYLAAATVYLLARGRAAVLVAAVAVTYLLVLADGADRLPVLLALRPYLDLGSTVASHGAVTLSGVLLGLLLMRSQEQNWAPRRVVAAGLGVTLGLALAGVLVHALRDLHPTFHINKIHATAAWCLLSSAWTAGAWTVLYALIEWRGWRRWPRAITVAGENALLAFLVPPLLVLFFALVAPLFGGVDLYKALGTNLATGTVRAVVFCCLVVWLSAAARRRGLRMQL